LSAAVAKSGTATSTAAIAASAPASTSAAAFSADFVSFVTAAAPTASSIPASAAPASAVVPVAAAGKHDNDVDNDDDGFGDDAVWESAPAQNTAAVSLKPAVAVVAPAAVAHTEVATKNSSTNASGNGNGSGGNDDDDDFEFEDFAAAAASAPKTAVANAATKPPPPPAPPAPVQYDEWVRFSFSLSSFVLWHFLNPSFVCVLCVDFLFPQAQGFPIGVAIKTANAAVANTASSVDDIFFSPSSAVSAASSSSSASSLSFDADFESASPSSTSSSSSGDRTKHLLSQLPDLRFLLLDVPTALALQPAACAALDLGTLLHSNITDKIKSS
jgi:hypothetical protein